ncbi:hypothetical protein E1A91_A13G155600v1 [Gossypium mustelinum]|uniref:ABC-type xenobiotic transporter n=1 Tax=Gossypium mustelinum TaxID=34275 RepID=A0A5D2WIH0_GOSMU|nr:hypothetical protein E1A91_A13G155600v1 [Gossypium mustelinum]
MDTNTSFDFLLKPIFLHGFSAALHMVLLLFFLVSLVVNRVKEAGEEGSKETLRQMKVSWHKQTLGCCFVVSAFNIVLCLLSYFYQYGNVWSKDKLVTLSDYVLKILVWGAILVVDIVDLKKHASFPSQYLVSDVFSVITEKRGDTVTPYSNASIFSILTFSWMGPSIATGNKKTLDLEDVPQLDSRDSVVGAFPKFRNRLEAIDGEGTEVTTLKLVKALFFSVWKDILWTGLFVFIYTVASYVGPYLIDTFVQYLNGQRVFKNEGYLLVTAFFVAKLVECTSQRWLRAVLIAMICNKGLTVSCQSKQSQTSGEIINYMTVDAERVGDFSWYMHDLWMVALQLFGFFPTTLALLILYKNLRLAAIAAFVTTILVMLANIPLGKMLEKFQDKLMKSKDERMKATSEILRNMRIFKLQGWEMKFLSKIIGLTSVEEGWLKRFVYTNAMTSFLFWIAPSFVSVATFGACILLGIPLESGKILSALATFRILQEPIYNLPDTISMIVQTKVSLDRIATFLRLDDLQPDAMEKLPKGSSNTAIEIVDGNFSWDLASSSPTLKDINLKVFHGMRVAVCGTVGSGKSSLLSFLWYKSLCCSVTLDTSGKIEENILFGKAMDRERYDQVLEGCSLKKDLEILSFGDQTVIGERGINLSGGQKQRIQIARALYQDADIYLFDDPFSAVDAHTGSYLFKEVLLGILSSKTLIYVTHQVEFLPAADLILVMKNGRITQAGKYNDILNSALSALDTVEAGSVSEKRVSEGDGASGSASGEMLKEGNENSKVDDDGPKGQLYITTAYGGALIPFILLAQILFQVFQIGSNYWMAWASPVSADVKPPVTNLTLIIVYLALAFASAFSVFARSMLLNTAGYKTATLLFKKMHLCIFRAPMFFFDSTPSGRILNRLSICVVDLTMPLLVEAFAFSVIQLLGIIVVISQVAWQIFIIFLPVIATCIWYQQYYISSARELARLVGVCKAPVIQSFSETILGATTIRSFDQESRFQQKNMELMDAYSRPKFYVAGAREWLCFRLDMLSSITFAFSLFFLIFIPKGIIDPAIAGLAVTYGLNLNMLQAWVVWNICSMENRIISVERILQYSGIPREPALDYFLQALFDQPQVLQRQLQVHSCPNSNKPSHQTLHLCSLGFCWLKDPGSYNLFLPYLIETNRPNRSWPFCGEVHIHDLYASHMPLVLRGLTCTFPGAGQIIIDGVSISSIGLQDLRLRLSIIPQDPTMFEGTVRSNLDPLKEYTDEQIWEVLDKCQLGDEVRKKEGKLESSISENGENWSMGQKQLVCLGRVLLKKSKILVLDEATASVDTATDNLIQTTLREHFCDCTVITIAHRITSVVDSDMVLLLSQGVIEEYDSPARLLENKSSSFAQLVAEYSIRSK